jgi:hypothetical protein
MKSTLQPSEARKAYLRKYLAEYRKKNKAKLLESNKAWRNRNRAKMRDYSRNYGRMYTERNQGKIREYKRAWYVKRQQQRTAGSTVVHS